MRGLLLQMLFACSIPMRYYTGAMSYAHARAHAFAGSFSLISSVGQQLKALAESPVGHKPPFPRFIRPRLQVKVRSVYPWRDRNSARNRTGIKESQNFAKNFFNVCSVKKRREKIVNSICRPVKNCRKCDFSDHTYAYVCI